MFAGQPGGTPAGITAPLSSVVAGLLLNASDQRLWSRIRIRDKQTDIVVFGLTNLLYV
jgi:hypothetical protein